MTRRYKHDLFVHELVREISSAPEAMHREFRLSDEVRLPQIFDKQTEADLRALLTLEDIPARPWPYSDVALISGERQTRCSGPCSSSTPYSRTWPSLASR